MVISFVYTPVMKNLDPPVQIFRNIWTPMELIFQELDEIFRLPIKFLDPPLQRVNKLFLKFKTVLKAKIVKTAIM